MSKTFDEQLSILRHVADGGATPHPALVFRDALTAVLEQRDRMKKTIDKTLFWIDAERRDIIGATEAEAALEAAIHPETPVKESSDANKEEKGRDDSRGSNQGGATDRTPG